VIDAKKEYRVQLKALKSKLDEKALMYLDRLLEEAGEIKCILPTDNIANIPAGGISVIAKNASFVLGPLKDARALCLAEEESRKQEQYTTHAEYDLYCQGTKRLFNLLVNYKDIVTDKAVIVAFPEVNTWRNDTASLKREDLKFMDNERVAIVSLAYEDGFISFVFKETVKLRKQHGIKHYA